MRRSGFFKGAVALAVTAASSGVVLWFAWGRSLTYDVCSTFGVEGFPLSTSCYEEEFSTPFQVFVTSIVSSFAAATVLALAWLLGRLRAKNRARPLLMALPATLVFACEGVRAIGGDPSYEDPWLEPPPGSFAGWTRLSRQDVEPVWPAERLDAVQLLQTRRWLAISPTQAERLTGESPATGKTPYLLRGLCIRCGKGSFMLLQRGTELALHHASAPILQTRATRWPVVAWLDRAPSRLYVSCDDSGSRPAARR